MHFGDFERHINNIFKVGQKVRFNNNYYTILKSGKPTLSYGEPKTDIYLLLHNDSQNLELKISVKKNNADFIENKMSAIRAEQVFGKHWMDIIIQSTSQIKDRFLSRPLIYKSKKGRSQAGSITIGWKFELLNKLSGELSGQMLLTKEQLFDIYAGTNLPKDKKDAKVNGSPIINSGVANYILFDDLTKFNSTDEVFQVLKPIDQYIENHPNIYFACKALNYRTFKRKFDGNRPLYVFVNWKVINNKLYPKFIFDKPLITRGNEVVDLLLTSLKQLGISTTNDINDDNVSSMDYVYK
jgi:hypothetical protein